MTESEKLAYIKALDDFSKAFELSINNVCEKHICDCLESNLFAIHCMQRSLRIAKFVIGKLKGKVGGVNDERKL